MKSKYVSSKQSIQQQMNDSKISRSDSSKLYNDPVLKCLHEHFYQPSDFKLSLEEEDTGRNTLNNSFQDHLAMSNTIVFNKYQTLDEPKRNKK